MTGIRPWFQSCCFFYVLINSLGHTGTGPQHSHLWESNPNIGDSLQLDAKPANPLGHWGPLHWALDEV